MMRDAVIRRELHKKLIADYENDSTTRIIHELSLCQSAARIDIAVVNGCLHGYEIKSELDTLQRLPSQISTYNQVFDYLTIVIGSKHLRNLKRKIPKEWGIIAVDKDKNGVVHFETIRETKKNPRVTAYGLAQLLWKNEALGLLTETGIEKGYKTKPRRVIWRKIASDVPLEALQIFVREAIKLRQGWLSDQQQILSGDSYRLAATY